MRPPQIPLLDKFTLVVPWSAQRVLRQLEIAERIDRRDGISPDPDVVDLMDRLRRVDREFRGDTATPRGQTASARWIAVKVAAPMFPMSTQGVRDLVKAGALTHRTQGRMWFVEEGEVRRLVATRAALQPESRKANKAEQSPVSRQQAS